MTTRSEALARARFAVSVERNCDADCLHSDACATDFEERLLEAAGWDSDADEAASEREERG